MLHLRKLGQLQQGPGVQGSSPERGEGARPVWVVGVSRALLAAFGLHVAHEGAWGEVADVHITEGLECHAGDPQMPQPMAICLWMESLARPRVLLREVSSLGGCMVRNDRG